MKKNNFWKCANFFVLKGDLLNVLTDFNLITADTTDAKMIIGFFDEMRFDTNAGGKSVGGRKVIKNFIKTKSLLASGLGGSSSQKKHFHFRNTRWNMW